MDEYLVSELPVALAGGCLEDVKLDAPVRNVETSREGQPSLRGQHIPIPGACKGFVCPASRFSTGRIAISAIVERMAIATNMA